MSNGLIKGKIYLKEREITVERLIFKENGQIKVILDNMEDIIHLKSNYGFDIQFNDTILLNCGMSEFDKLKKVCIGNYKIKRNLA